MDKNTDPPKEIDVDELLGTPARHEFLAYNPQMKTLPFDQVPWDRFEKLATQLLKPVFGSRLIQAFGYGRSGQAQYGIDVIALKPGSAKQLVMQCKNVRRVKHGQLREWVQGFLTQKKFRDADHYILSPPAPCKPTRNSWTNGPNKPRFSTRLVSTRSCGTSPG